MRKLIYLTAIIFSLSNAGGYVETATAPITPIIPSTPPVIGMNNFYIGGAISAVSARKSDADLNFFDEEPGQDRLLNLMVLGGYNFNEYFAVEGRLSTTISEKDFAKATIFSIFAKPQYPVTENLTLYALIGGGYIKLDNYNGSNVDVSEASFQAGVGGSYDIDSKWSVFADYTFLGKDLDGTILDSNEADVDSINVGVIYKF